MLGKEERDGIRDEPMKFHLRFLVCACATLTIAVAYAQAAIYDIEYSGTFTTILDANGNPGGSFSSGNGISLNDTYQGTFRLITENAVVDTSMPVSGVTDYDFGVSSPSLTVNGSDVSLTTMVGLSVANDIDPTIATYIAGGVRESGFDPLPASSDFLLVFTDIPGFDGATETGAEIIMVMFDPTSSALSGTGIPNPLSPLSNSFFIYLETVNGTTMAAGIGPTNSLVISPEPTSGLLLGTGLLAILGMATRRRARYF